MLTLLLALPLSLATHLPSDGDWPHIRGPHLDGQVSGSGAFGSGAFGLRVAWRKTLGPAYAGVAVADGLALTTFSADGRDQVIALDAATGKERWRHDLEPTYLGHDGSEDGTIASPVVGAGTVYVISARGMLVALGLADGKPRWNKDLVAAVGAVVPEYGFGSTPLLEGGLLIVQAGGGEGRFLCAFDAATGEPRWSVGEGTLQYTSPIAMDLAGRRQVVVLNQKEILGIAPEDGAVLWRHALTGERDAVSSGMATAMDGERFCVNVSGTLVVFRLARTADGFALEETVRVRELGRSYATPVYFEGRLYGFKSDFLTCCDATSGERLWKSRPPGGRGLILVDGRLVVYGAQGTLAVVDADGGDYHELATVQALEHTGYTWPSFGSGRVFLRNSAELVGVEVVPGLAAKAVAGEAPAAAAGALGALLAALPGAEDREARITAFLAAHPSLPIVEGGQAHFLYRGKAEDVALAGSWIDGSRPDPLQRVAGTDLFHRSYPIEAGARWEYRLQIDYGDWISDPANPRTAPADFGNPMSVVQAPGGAPPMDAGVQVPAGTLQTLEFTSPSLGNTREIRVWLPPGYEQGSERYPLALLHQGPEWLENGGLPAWLDRRVGRDFRPAVVVFVTPIDEWWHEGGGTGTEEYVDALAAELVPFLAERFRLSPDAADHALLGKESFGLTALLGALRHPEVFGRAGVVTLALGDISRHALFEALENDPPKGLAFFLGWNRYEARNRDRGYDYRAESQRTAEALRKAGYAVAGGEVLDSGGWGSWPGRMVDALTALFPVE